MDIEEIREEKFKELLQYRVCWQTLYLENMSQKGEKLELERSCLCGSYQENMECTPPDLAMAYSYVADRRNRG